MPSLRSAIPVSKIRIVWQKRWASISAACLLLALLLMQGFDLLLPNDQKQRINLVSRGWQSSANNPCRQQLAPKTFYQITAQEIYGEVYYSSQGDYLQSPSVARGLTAQENESPLPCLKIFQPSFVEEVAYEAENN
jgi:hypothetical protein